MSEASTAKKQPKVNLEAGKTDAGNLRVSVAFPSGHAEHFEFNHEHPLYEHFAVHGVGKKVRDTIATIKEPEKQHEAVKSLFGAFAEGKWNAHRAESGSGTGGAGVLARALSALYGKSIEEAQKFVANLNKKQQSDMRRLPDVAAKIAELSAEKSKDSGAADLLASFKSLGEAEQEETAEAE